MYNKLITLYIFIFGVLIFKISYNIDEKKLEQFLDKHKMVEIKTMQ